MRLPRILFLNKIDLAGEGVRETLAMLQPASRTPLLLRQLPVWQHGVATGFVDLALERAFLYREHAPSTVIETPDGVARDQKEARYSMLERLADYDDALMEQLISEIEPPRDRVFDDLARELRDGHVVPLLMGSADRGHGVTRLLKALRHEAPGIAQTRERLGDRRARRPPLAQVVRTIHTGHGGKLSLARVLRGAFADGGTVVGSRGAEERIAGLSRLMGAASAKIARAEEGDTVAFARLEHIATGDRFAEGKKRAEAADAGAAAAADPIARLARQGSQGRGPPRRRAGQAYARRTRADLHVHDQELGELKLMGQGEMHLRVTIERLAARFGVAVEAKAPSVAYRETIRDAVSARGRHKKQSGGHGQFGDVAVEVAPRARGEGFAFAETRAWRHGAAPVFFLGRSGRARRADARAARLSRRRCRRHPDRRLLSYGRFLRHGVSRGGQNRARRSACPRRGRFCSSRCWPSRSSCPTDAMARASALVTRGAARSSASSRARDGRAGTSSAR